MTMTVAAAATALVVVLLASLAGTAAAQTRIEQGAHGQLLVRRGARVSLVCANYTAFDRGTESNSLRDSLGCGDSRTTVAGTSELYLVPLSVIPKSTYTSIGYWLPSAFDSIGTIESQLVPLPYGGSCGFVLGYKCVNQTTLNVAADGTLSFGAGAMPLCGEDIDQWLALGNVTFAVNRLIQQGLGTRVARVPCTKLTNCTVASLRPSIHTLLTESLNRVARDAGLSRGFCPSKLVLLAPKHPAAAPLQAQLTNTSFQRTTLKYTIVPGAAPPFAPLAVVSLGDPDWVLCSDSPAISSTWLTKLCPAGSSLTARAAAHIPLSALQPTTPTRDLRILRLAAGAVINGADAVSVGAQLFGSAVIPPSNFTCTYALAVNCSVEARYDAGPTVTEFAGLPLCDQAPRVSSVLTYACDLQGGEVPAARPVPSPYGGDHAFASWNYNTVPTSLSQSTFSTVMQSLVPALVTNNSGPSGVACRAMASACERPGTCAGRLNSVSGPVEYVDTTNNATTDLLHNSSYFDFRMAAQACLARGERFFHTPAIFTAPAPAAAPIGRRAFSAGLCVVNKETDFRESIVPTSVTATDLCNVTACAGAAVVPQPVGDRVIGVDCSPEFEVAIDPRTKLPPPAGALAAPDSVYGAILGRRKARNAGEETPWTAMSGESIYPAVARAPSTPLFFSDELALGLCRLANASANFTHADAIVARGAGSPTIPVGFMDMYCMQYFEPATEDPLTAQWCGYYYTQSAPYVLPPEHGAAVRCGRSPTACPHYTPLQVNGVYCGEKDYAGVALLIETNTTGMYVRRIAIEQPLANQSAGEAYPIGTVDGLGCRVGREYDQSWRDLLPDLDMFFLLIASIGPQNNPLTGKLHPQLRVVSAFYEATTFARCSSCPPTAPLGRYCARGGDAYLHLYIKTVQVGNTTTSVEMLSYYPTRSSHTPTCTVSLADGIETGFGARCVVRLRERCPDLAAMNLAYFVEDLVIADDTPTGLALYDFCSVTSVVTCPATISGNFYGASKSNATRTMRLVFNPSNNTFDLFYSFSGVESAICLNQRFDVRNTTQGTFCAVDMPVFGDISAASCLRDTRLLGQTQSSTGLVYDPTDGTIELHLLTDTYVLERTPTCVAAADAAYCSDRGLVVIDLDSTQNRTTYTIDHVLSGGSVYAGKKPGVVQQASDQPCVYTLRENATGVPWGALDFRSDAAAVKIGARESAKEIMDAPQSDSLRLCSTESVPTGKYCPSTDALDYILDIKDRLNGVAKGDDRDLPFTFLLQPNNVVTITNIDTLKGKDPAFAKVKSVTFVDDAEGLLFLMEDAGYVRFPPCHRLSILQVVGYAIVALLGLLVLGFLAKKNYQRVREVAARRVQHMSERATAAAETSKARLRGASRAGNNDNGGSYSPVAGDDDRNVEDEEMLPLAANAEQPGTATHDAAAGYAPVAAPPPPPPPMMQEAAGYDDRTVRDAPADRDAAGAVCVTVDDVDRLEDEAEEDGAAETRGSSIAGVSDDNGVRLLHTPRTADNDAHDDSGRASVDVAGDDDEEREA